MTGDQPSDHLPSFVRSAAPVRTGYPGRGVLDVRALAKAYAEKGELENWEIAEWEVDELLETRT